MTRLQLSVAMGDYDRNRALFDGRTQIDGCDPTYMLLSPEEMFFRAPMMRSLMRDRRHETGLLIGPAHDIDLRHTADG